MTSLPSDQVFSPDLEVGFGRIFVAYRKRSLFFVVNHQNFLFVYFFETPEDCEYSICLVELSNPHEESLIAFELGNLDGLAINR